MIVVILVLYHKTGENLAADPELVAVRWTTGGSMGMESVAVVGAGIIGTNNSVIYQLVSINQN